MSKRKNKQQNRSTATSTSEKIAPTKSKIVKGSALDILSKSNQQLLFHKGNYMIILAGLGLIFIGYVLMSGGHMPDSNTWDPDIIYSTRRTLIAPIFILTGLGLEIYAIFKK